MDGEQEHEEKEVRDVTEREASEVSSKENDSSDLTPNGTEKDGVPAEVGATHHGDKNSESMKVTEEPPGEAAEPGNSGDELPGLHTVTTCKDWDGKKDEVREESVVFEINSDYDDDDHHHHHHRHEPPRLHLETPQREGTTSPAQDSEEEASTAAPAQSEDIAYKEHVRLFRELCEERDEASRHSSRLQGKLAEYLRRKAGDDDAQLGREMLVSEQLREYEKRVDVLAGLKRQLAAESEAARLQAEGLRSQSQEKLGKVQNEWQEFVELKQHIAVTVLSRYLGKQVAQGKVESALAAEQLWQDELIKRRLKHIKLRIRIIRLEAELQDKEEHVRDPLQLHFEQLQAARMEQKKHAEKQSEEVLKLQSKVSSSLELLSNVKEKLFWGRMEVQAKQQQLAEVEATVAWKRELLIRTKQACNSLQTDNLRLKECCGLLGNRVLLRDFEDTVDASDHLEEQLENLKCRHAEIVLSCGRWEKKRETTL